MFQGSKCSDTVVVLQGFVVLALEHADGTAATVQLAGSAGHKFYSGWLSEEERLDQTRFDPIDDSRKVQVHQSSKGLVSPV